jgi:hypothetical protein
LTFFADRGRDNVGDTGVIHHRAVHVVFVAIDVHSTFGSQRHHFLTSEFAVVGVVLDGEPGQHSHA